MAVDYKPYTEFKYINKRIWDNRKINTDENASEMNITMERSGGNHRPKKHIYLNDI
jgi:hypothetical protein